tara:strand:- start:6419 stop:7666 length:1248 start_codon:yes stop_codon:yes gene_type:complete
MIDPRLSLAVQVPDAKQAIDVYKNTLLTNEQLKASKQNREHNEALLPLQKALLEKRSKFLDTQNELGGMQITKERGDQWLRSVSDFIALNKSTLSSRNPDAILPLLQKRRSELVASQLPTETTDEAIAMVQSGDFERLESYMGDTLNYAQQRGVGMGGGSWQFGSTQTIKDSQGNIFHVTQARNPRTNQVETRYSALGEGPAQPVGAVDIVSSNGETSDERTTRERETAGYGATQARKTKAIEAAVRQGEAAFEKLEPTRKAISNIDDAIKAIDEGAETGFIASKLPSIKEASIKLDNIQKRMGLDVISNTTFGALSEGELDLALKTALPTNLKGPALKEWLLAKKTAMNKLHNYVRDAAAFLTSGEHTIKDWLELQQAKAINQSNQSTEAIPETEGAQEVQQPQSNDFSNLWGN